MLKLIATAALIAATATAAASSQSLQPDLRCTDADMAMTERLRDVLAQDRQHVAGTAPINMVLARMAAARLDCKHGRIDRGLMSYAQADAALQAIEETTRPLAARSGGLD